MELCNKICEICIELRECFQCSNCNGYQCISCCCINTKCCHCNQHINIYNFLLYPFSRETRDIIYKRLHIIYYKKSEKFEFIFTLFHIFEEWILSDKNLVSIDIDLLFDNMKKLSYEYFNDLPFSKNIFSELFKYNDISNDDFLKITKGDIKKEYSKKYSLTDISQICGEIKKISKQVFFNKKLVFYYIDENSETDKNFLCSIGKSRQKHIIPKECNKILLNDYNNNIIIPDYTKIIPILYKSPEDDSSTLINKINFFLLLKSICPKGLITEQKCTCNEIICNVCNVYYCKYCLSDIHLDNQECTLKNTQPNYDSIKLCPNCKILIYKQNGCDDMWCINCKVFFSWRQGILRKDSPHNPDYTNYIMQNKDKLKILKYNIKRDILREIKKPGDESETFIKQFYNSKLYDLNILSEINTEILPELIKQSFIFKIFMLDDLLDFSNNNSSVKSIIFHCDSYRFNMDKLFGLNKHVITFSSIVIDTSKYTIIYKI